MQTNLTDFYQALKDNFRGVSNKKYIQDSIRFHMFHEYITPEEAVKLEEEFL